MSVERLQSMIAHACFAKEPPPDDLRAYLEGHGVAPEDALAILASPRRLGLYRKLVRHNVVNVAGLILDGTRARLDARSPGAWDAAIDAFLAETGPKTPHLRDVPAELLAHASPRWRADAGIPPWIADFAAYELADFTVGVAPRPSPPPPLADVAPDRPLVFAEPRALLRLAWAVHELDADDLAAEPAKRDVVLFAYRDAEHVTQFLSLTPLAAAILERLFAGAPLAEAVRDACAAEGAPIDEHVLASAARLLADLGERGVLLGARA